MALKLGEVVGKIGGGVILDRDVAITVGDEWVDVTEFEITTASHIAATITHTVVGPGDSWGSPAPTVLVSPADGRSLVPGVSFTRANCTIAPGELTIPLNTAGQLEPGKYRVRAHSQKFGRNVGLTHVTVIAVPA